MYEENKNNTNLLSTILKIVIAILLVILSVKLVSIIMNHRETNVINDNMQENLKNLDSFAQKYFTEDKRPTELGDSVKVTLDTLVESKELDVIKDKDDNECSMDKSYIEFTLLENEYQIKSYLVCPDATDYTNTFIELDTKEETTTTSKVKDTTKKTTKKTTTKVATTKVETTTTSKATTTKKVTTKAAVVSYEVSFNANGGNEIKPVKVNENGLVSLPTPVRDGYTFVGWYLNGSKFDSNTRITSNLVLVAKWTK